MSAELFDNISLLFHCVAYRLEASSLLYKKVLKTRLRNVIYKW